MNKKLKTDQKPVAPILKKMKVGDTEAYPISRMLVVKSTATLLGASLSREYSTSTIRRNGVILITRIA